MSNVLFAVYCLIISAAMTNIYFSKRHAVNRETKSYEYLVISCLVENVLLVALMAVTSLGDKAMKVSLIVGKLYMISLLMCLASYFLIVVAIFSKKAPSFRPKFLCFAPALLVGIVSCVFTTELRIYDIGSYEAYGTGVEIAYAYAALSFIGATFICIVKRKRTKIKMLPMFLVIGFCVLGVSIQFFHREQMIITTALHTLVLIVLYFTIENPDMHLVDIVNKEKENAVLADKSKSDFLASMSHEIGTPLNTILGMTEDILNNSEKKEFSEEVYSKTEQINRAALNLFGISQNIIDICQLEDENIQISEQEYDLKKEINFVVSAYEHLIKDRQVTYIEEISEALPTKLMGDIKCIRVVLNNLISNSFKYTHIGFIVVKVECVNADDNCHLVISVKDTGLGMTEEKRKTAFEKFDVMNSDKGYSSVSFGLMVTKKIVTALGGSIELESEYGKGTEIIVNVDQKIVAQEKETAAKKNDLRHFGRKKILIVDDVAINISVCKTVLSDSDFKLVGATSGFECLKNVKESNDFDLIFMDIMMPEMDGIETYRRLRDIPDFHTPVVALSADMSMDAIVRYTQEGFYDYLAKPYTMDDMVNVLERQFVD